MKFIYIVLLFFLPLSAFSDVGLQSVDYFYDFGLRELRSSTYKSFNIKNVGEVPLTFKYIVAEGIEYRARHDCKNGVQPNASCRVEIEFNPRFEGASKGLFEVNFVEIDTILIEVRGYARRK